MARVVISTYEKAIRIKEQRGEIVRLSREASSQIDVSVSRSFSNWKRNHYDKK